LPLTPDIKTPVIYQSKIKPSKTYVLNFETGDITGKVDGKAAIEQFICKAIKTARYRHPIYSPAYGCELEELIGQGYTGPLMEAEIIRVINEALIYDERIKRVYGFKVNATNDRVEVEFNVDTIEGVIKASEVIGNV
jgi:hypothetical protein